MSNDGLGRDPQAGGFSLSAIAVGVDGVAVPVDSPETLEGVYRIYLQDGSVATSGLFDEQDLTGLDVDATYKITTMAPSGYVTFFDGGAFTVSAIAPVGDITFTIEIYELGALSTQFNWTHTVS